jgi:hypothetical protein
MEECNMSYLGCEASTLELCLAARSSPCHEQAIAYTLKQCSPTSCFEVSLMKEYANPEELKRLKEGCNGCRW